MIETDQFTTWLAIWLAALALILWGQRKGSAGVGLVLAYALQLWVIHWLAPAMYALPWYGPPTPILFAGLQQSTYAILGFAIGATIVVMLFTPKLPPNGTTEPETVALADPWLLRWCLSVGVLSYVLLPIARGIPTVAALVSVASNLLVVAVAMECWNGIHNPGRSIWRWIALAALLPFITIVTQGFLSYGFAAMLTVFAFVGCIYRPRWKVVALGLVVSYLALSIFVTYMRDRRAIREVVWNSGSYSDRLAEMEKTFGDFEFLDFRNIDHLNRIDDRLNQNTLLGTSVAYLSTRPDEFARGETLWDAMLSPIPRALWRDKPMVAGSGDLVSRFTGMKFDVETSVGIGHVMEWYVNFGAPGVFFGSMLFGIGLGLIDRIAVTHLQHGDWSRFCFWYLSALSLLQVGGSLVEAVGGAAAGMVIGVVILNVRPPQWTPDADRHPIDDTSTVRSRPVRL